MNQVSWRRILERAEDNLPAEGETRSPGAYAPPPRMREMRPLSPAMSVRDASAVSFEDDLRFALEKAASQSYEPPAPPLPAPAPARPQNFVRQQPPRLHQPVHPHAQAHQPNQYQQQQLAVRPQAPQYAARHHTPVPPAPVYPTEYGQRNMLVPVAEPARYARRRREPEPKRGGVRNFVVVSLSTAVLAFAVNEIGAQWRNVHEGVTSTRTASNTSAQPGYSGTVEAGVMPSTMTFQTIAPEETAPSTPVTGSITARNSATTGAALPSANEIREAVRALKEENAQSLSDVEAAPPAPVGRQAAITQMEEQVLMRRATSLLEDKDVSGARKVLEYLAGRNSAVGAYSLAQTYDAKFLRGMGAAGVVPDQTLAQKWYKQAASLGSGEAQAYLNTQRN